jgi:hypothetical protein
MNKVQFLRSWYSQSWSLKFIFDQVHHDYEEDLKNEESDQNFLKDILGGTAF